MIVTLQTERVQTLEQVRAFVEGSEAVDPRTRFRGHKLSRGRAFTGAGRESVYEFVRRALVRLGYERLGKWDKGLVRRYLAKVTGLSRAQLTRLIGHSIARPGALRTGAVVRRRAPSTGQQGDHHPGGDEVEHNRRDDDVAAAVRLEPSRRERPGGGEDREGNEKQARHEQRIGQVDERQQAGVRPAGKGRRARSAMGPPAARHSVKRSIPGEVYRPIELKGSE